MTQKISGDFCWVELWSRDLTQAKDFYGDVLGWTFSEETMPDGRNYTFMKLGEVPVAGAFELHEEVKKQGVPSFWSCYVMVDDVDNTVFKAKELGAEVLRDGFDVGDYGRMAILLDPQGATFCLWQAKREEGPHLPAELHGNRCWYELLTSDLEQAKKFYGELFGWQFESKEMQPGQDYTTIYNGDKQIAGLMAFTEASQEVPPYWQIYFTVDNLDQTLEKAQAKHAKAMYEPINYPEVGRFTSLQEQGGAQFSVIQLP